MMLMISIPRFSARCRGICFSILAFALSCLAAAAQCSVTPHPATVPAPPASTTQNNQSLAWFNQRFIYTQCTQPCSLCTRHRHHGDGRNFAASHERYAHQFAHHQDRRKTLLHGDAQCSRQWHSGHSLRSHSIWNRGGSEASRAAGRRIESHLATELAPSGWQKLPAVYATLQSRRTKQYPPDREEDCSR